MPDFAVLHKRELEIVKLVVQGISNPDVGENLHISEQTVKRHLSNIFDKLGCDNRTQLASWWYREVISGLQAELETTKGLDCSDHMQMKP